MARDLRPLHRSALDAAGERLRRVTPEDLSRPTPCAGWDLAALLAHMVGQHHGFAAAVRDGDAPVAAYAPVPYTPESWQRSASALLAAFDAADLDARVVEVELAPTPLPVAFLVSAQLLDTVVHTWDVTQALGVPYEPGPEQVAEVARLAARIPDDAGRERPGAAFGHAVPADGTPWQQALARLGRDPGR